MVKPGPIIGLIIGIGLAVFPIIGFLMGEGSLSDSKGKMIGFGFIIFGVFMVAVNIIVLVTGKENLLASSNDATSAPVQYRAKSKVKSEPAEEEPKEESEEEPEEKMIRCRFCKKRYSTDYNGCPYCKKK